MNPSCFLCFVYFLYFKKKKGHGEGKCQPEPVPKQGRRWPVAWIATDGDGIQHSLLLVGSTTHHCHSWWVEWVLRLWLWTLEPIERTELRRVILQIGSIRLDLLHSNYNYLLLLLLLLVYRSIGVWNRPTERRRWRWEGRWSKRGCVCVGGCLSRL